MISALLFASSSIPLYELAYAQSGGPGGNALVFRSGVENSTMAYATLSHPNCGSSCPPHVPIQWGAAVAIASFGSTVIQSDAIAASGSLVAVAVSTNGNTQVYFSAYYGASGSWVTLTATGLISGASPRMQVSSCDVFVTTLTGANTLATTFPLGCLLGPTPGTVSPTFRVSQSLVGPPQTPPPPPPAPSVSSVAPTEGYDGELVKVMGTYFGPGAQVFFGAFQSQAVTVVSDTQLLAIAPPTGSTGTVDIQVQTTSGSSPITPSDHFYYQSSHMPGGPVPQVASVSPSSGPSGSTVMVFGSGFSLGTPTVYFGTSIANPNSVTVFNDGQLQATVPGGQTLVDIRVSVNGQVSPINWPSDSFTYTNTPWPPTVGGVSPNWGTAGGTVSVIGTNFTSDAQVYFAGVAAASVSVQSGTQLTAQVPLAAPLGLDEVQVQADGGTSALNPPYDQVDIIYTGGSLQVTGISPSQGYSGTVVTVTGNGFDPGAQVLFGGVAASQVSVESHTMLVAAAPATGQVGALNVQVQDDQGLSAINAPADQYSYSQVGLAPTLTSVSPTVGSSGSSVQITGTGFVQGQTQVYFGTHLAASVTVYGGTSLQAQVPTGQGVVDVQVSVNGEISAINWPLDMFTYSGSNPPPTVAAVLPDSGTWNTAVIVVGTGFQPGSSVTFLGQSSLTVVGMSTTELVAVAPNGISVGTTVDVQVNAGNGVSNPNPPYDQFTFQTPGAVTVTGLSPSRGPVGTNVTVYGTNFSSSATVHFGAYASPSVTVQNSGVLTAEAPVAVGTLDVTVTSYGATSATTSVDQFTFTGTPVSHSLPLSVGTQPLLITTSSNTVTEGVLASIPSNDSIEWFTSTNNFVSYATTWISHFNASFGSAVFTRIGGTNLQLYAGAGGEITGTVQDPYIFGAYTTRTGGADSLVSLMSADAGAHWKLVNVVSAPKGAIENPVAAPSPNGYVYLTWRENGAGPWEVDQTVLSDSGSVLLAPQPIPNSGGGNATAATSATVVVDHFQRPLFVWATLNQSGIGVLNYTGEFLSAGQIVALSQSALSRTQGSDYARFGQPGWSAFRPALSSALSTTQSYLSSHSWSSAQSETLGVLYPNMSVTHPGYAFGSSPPNCTGSLGAGSTGFANGSGPFEAGTFMGIYVAWLLQAEGCGILGKPAWLGTPEHGGLVVGPSNPATVPFGSPGSLVQGGNSVKVTPIALNPNLVLLNASGIFPGRTVIESASYGVCWSFTTPNGNLHIFGPSVTYQPRLYQSTISVGSSSSTYWSTSAVPIVYLTNVSSQTSGKWTDQVTVSFSQQAYCKANNTAWKWTAPRVGPAQVTLTVSGNLTTWLGYNQVPPRAIDNNGTLSINWTNSMRAAVHLVSIDMPGSGNFYASSSTTQGAIDERFTFTNVPASGSGSLAYSINSSAGSNRVIGGSQLNLAQAGTLSRPLWNNQSCNFAMPSTPVSVWAGNVSNVTASDANLTWWSHSLGTGWVQYTDGNGIPYEAQAPTRLNKSTQGNLLYEYLIELHGLTPWSKYTVTVGVTTGSSGTGGSCIQFQNSAQESFMTVGLLPMTEQELPYDSVTQTGGGALVDWSAPFWFVASSTFAGGNLWYCPGAGPCSGSGTVQVPLNLSVIGSTWAFGTNSVGYALNLTGLTLNTTYNVVLQMNFTYGGLQYDLAGAPLPFRYAKDTTGSGLTDWEKVRGWNVTAQNAVGSWYTYPATANPNQYATNGLVKDFVEKEFALNPNTVDTSGSHMLDTWNLTLAVTSHTCPSGFLCWYENNTSPFAFAQYPNEPQANITGGAAKQITQGSRTTINDSTKFDATYLWTGSVDLPYLQALVRAQGIGWLRAVTGYANGTDTLTVWGKLSWGANPLALSTSGSGVADGAQVNPLGTTFLNVTITSWNDSGVPNGAGVNSFINAVSGATVDYRGYTQQVTAGSYNGGGRSLYGGNLGMIYNFPVVSTRQFATFNVSLVQNSGGIISNAANVGPVQVDLASAQSHTASVNPSGISPSLVISYRAITVYSKAPTYVVVPGSNSTLSSLPVGLMRYTGEQNFVLLELDLATSGGQSLSLTGIPYPNASAPGNWAGGYGVTLGAGLTNVLVPRTLFNNSPLEQAWLNKTNWTLSNHGYPVNLAGNWYPGYWHNRMASYSMYSNVSPLHVRFYSNSTSQSCVGNDPCGGIPSNPAAEASAPALTIQGIGTLNVTNQSDLNGLLAGLLLNHSGNITNWMFQATPYLTSLGLSSILMRALSNSSQMNAGAYGPPASNPSSPSVWQSAGAAIWNAVSGVAGAISVVWSAIVAAVCYMAELAGKVIAWGLKVLYQTISVLQNVSKAIVSALHQLLMIIWNEVAGLLSGVIRPMVQAANAFDQAAGSALNASLADVNTLGYVTQADGLKWAHSFDSILLIGLAIGVMVTVALALLTPIDLGVDFLLPVIFSLIAAFAQNAIPGLPSVSSFDSAGVLSFASGFPNSLSRAQWATIAGVVGVAAASADFLGALALLWIRTAVAGLPGLALAAAMIIDSIVLCVSLVNWALHFLILAGTILFFAAIGVLLSTWALRKGFTDLAGYAEVSFGLSLVGASAAGADYYLSQ